MAAVFHYAVIEGDVTKVRFLMKYSPALRVDSVNQFGLTALQQSTLDGNVDMVNFLLEKGADLSCVDSNGRTALHLAAQEGHLGVVSLLVTSACANVNAKTKQGEKAIDLARTDQVRALLSQAMLTESFKRKCSLEDDDLDSNYVYEYRNIPGCRNSLSSASTDSGVYDDSCSSQDSTNDQLKFYRASHSRVSSLRGYQSASSGHSVISEDSGMSDVSVEDRYRSRFESPRERQRMNGSPVTSMLKSQSYTDKLGIESAGESKGIARENRIESGRAELQRYRRAEPKSYVRDASRRRTVTFGMTEKERETERAETSVRYCGSSNNQNPIPKPQERNTNKQRTYSKTPPPVPPRVPPRPSPRSAASLKSKEVDPVPEFRPRPVPRRPRTEMSSERGLPNRRSFHAGFTQRGIN